jgi:hypothetical protein
MPWVFALEYCKTIVCPFTKCCLTVQAADCLCPQTDLFFRSNCLELILGESALYCRYAMCLTIQVWELARFMKDSVLSEEAVVSKVSELMETLDHIKRYNALARSLKKFSIIIIGSIILFLAVGILHNSLKFEYELMKPIGLVLDLLLVLIPLVGLALGVLYVRKQVNQTKTGEWKAKLAEGFPGALELIMKLDWENTLDEIYDGRLSYILYGLLKTAAYWFVAFFGLQLIANAFALYFLDRPVVAGSLFSLVFALLLALLLLGRDLFRRYKEIHALDMLLLELRWFSLELNRAEL